MRCLARSNAASSRPASAPIATQPVAADWGIYRENFSTGPSRARGAGARGLLSADHAPSGRNDIGPQERPATFGKLEGSTAIGRQGERVLLFPFSAFQGRHDAGRAGAQ